MKLVILGQYWLALDDLKIRTRIAILGRVSLSLYGTEPGSPLLGGRFSRGKARKCRPKILDLTDSQARDLRTAVLPDPSWACLTSVVLGRLEDGSN